MDTSKFTDSVIAGPGMWFVIHTTAIDATTDALKAAYTTNINNLCDKFKCEKCKAHFREYLNTHPLTKYWSLYVNGKDVGFFKWTWEFHNHVNAFLYKYQPTFEEAYTYFSDANKGVCTNCGDHTSPTQTVIASTPIVPNILKEYRQGSPYIKPKPFSLVVPTQR